MEVKEVKNLIKSIENATSANKLYENLKILRRVVDDKSKFTTVRESGGLRLILPYVPEKPEKIVAIILSIIGNCCMNRECSKEVVKYNGLSIFCNIIKKATEDSIICRVLRIIGNIAQFDNFASEIYKYKFVAIIVNLLSKSNENTEDGTQNDMDNFQPLSLDTEGMAVRALRNLWQSYSNRQNMIHDDVIRTVSMVLVKHTQIWLKKDEADKNTRKRREKLLEHVVKCLLLYSKWVTLVCAEQMLANGLGFKSLVALVDLYPYSAIKCLTNLSPVAKSRDEIDIAAAVQSIIDKLQFYLKRTNGCRCPNEIVNAFCLFSRHPLNCSEVKRAGGLTVILEVLKNCDSRKQESQIISALWGFLNDVASVNILVSNGIVEILIDCLERNLKSKKSLDEPHTYIKRKITKVTRKRKISRSSHTEGSRLFVKNCFAPNTTLNNLFIEMQMISGENILNKCQSPSDSESSVLSSPCCSPSRDIEEDNDDDSVNYSPVCSDTEETEVQQSSSSLTIPPILEEKEDENCRSEQEHFNLSDLSEKSIIVILIILTRILSAKPYPTDFSNLRTVDVLLKYVQESKFPQGRVSNVLNQICSNVDNILPLLLNGSVYRIYSLRQTQHDHSCAICFRMTVCADEVLGTMSELTRVDKVRDILCEQMHCDNSESKKIFIMVVPIIVRSKSLLKFIMYRSEGLNLLLSHYQSDLEDRGKIITALHTLACRIHINNPCVENLSKKSLKIPENFKPYNSDTNLITIKLDDGGVIITDRDFLIDKVEYFKAMFSGSFKEAEQDSVRLKNVSHNALNLLLFLLYSEIKVSILLEIDIDTVLEVIILTDSYLLENLTQWLTSCVECYMINFDSASKIYKWSVDSGTNFLRVETIAYLLTADMSHLERYKLCESISESGYITQLCNDFQKLIVRYLKMR